MGTELHAAEAFVFDLDDTLADTSGTLLDAALGRAAGALAAHLPADAPTLHDELREESAHRDGRDVFAGVAKRYPVERERTAVAVAAAREAYRSSPPDAIRLLPGARELLESLSTRCRLYLLTAGYAPTQRRKIELLGLARHFDAVRIVDRGDAKRAALAGFVADGGGDPRRTACVGDRRDHEIRYARDLGMTTVWIRGGEFAKVLASGDTDEPDFAFDGPARLYDYLRNSGEHDAQPGQ